MLSSIGPIYSYETTILRKFDGTELGKTVSVVNKKGWLHELNFLMHNSGEYCPSYTSKSGQNIGNPDHFTLIQNIFYIIN